ncbi:MAG: endonuclease domain-containing protein [Petrimonas sp.]|jgi:cyclase
MSDDYKNMFYGAGPILFEFAKNLRNNQTEAEQYLWNYLKGNQILNVRFKRQHPVLYFMADFYCHKAKLVIEIDGGYHRLPKQYEYDMCRDSELNRLGLEVLRFTNKEVFQETDKVIKIIINAVKQRLEDE